MITPVKKKSPMTRLEVRHMRDRILKVLQRGPQNTRYFATMFNATMSSMNPHMKALQTLGLVHSSRTKGFGQHVPYDWHLGPGEPIVHEPKPDMCIGGVPNQGFVKSWPPLNIPKQTPWSALGL